MAKFFHVLIIDDDPDDHQFFREALKDLTFAGSNAHDVISVSSVFDGAQGLEYLLKSGAFVNNNDPVPDLIVLDLNMPVMDGFVFLEKIRHLSNVNDVPVYVLTTSRDEVHRKKCRDLGCAGFFSKPPKLLELRAVVNKILNATPDE